MPRHKDPEFVRRLKGKPAVLAPEERIVHAQDDRILPPDFILENKDATKCWDRMAALLEKAELLVAVGRDKLARYCQAWADYSDVVRTRNRLTGSEKKITVFTKDKFRHWLAVQREAERTMDSFEQEYGLTPAAQMKIKKPNTETPADKFTAFLEEGAS